LYDVLTMEVFGGYKTSFAPNEGLHGQNAAQM